MTHPAKRPKVCDEKPVFVWRTVRDPVKVQRVVDLANRVFAAVPGGTETRLRFEQAIEWAGERDEPTILFPTDSGKLSTRNGEAFRPDVVRHMFDAISKHHPLENVDEFEKSLAMRAGTVAQDMRALMLLVQCFADAFKDDTSHGTACIYQRHCHRFQDQQPTLGVWYDDATPEHLDETPLEDLDPAAVPGPIDWSALRQTIDRHASSGEGTRPVAAVVTVADSDGDSDSGSDSDAKTADLAVVYHVGASGGRDKYLDLLGLGRGAAAKGWGLAAHPDPTMAAELAKHGLDAFVAEATSPQTERVLKRWDNRGVAGFRAMGDSMVVAVARA